jgi:hypothetical protein
MARFRSHCAAVLALIVGMYGCASTGPDTIAVLDSVTGVTVTRSRSPVTFYRDTPVRAAYARDFMSLGPIAVNRMGEYHYYLWLGAWSTMADWAPGQTRDALESTVLFIDGEPLLLTLSGWTPGSIDLSANVYEKASASTIEAYFEITLDQLRRLSEATDFRLLVNDSDARYYELWDQPASVRADLRRFYSTILP